MVEPNRYICDVLNDLRAIVKEMPDRPENNTIRLLIEEAQTYANRMESGLQNSRHTVSDIIRHIKKKEYDKVEQVAKKRWSLNYYEVEND